jgi:hypothetical protein
MDREEKTVLSVIGTLTGLTSTAGSVTIAVTTTKILGITVATSTVALPVAGIAVAGGALTYGGYKVLRWLRSQEVESSQAIVVPPTEPVRDVLS